MINWGEIHEEYELFDDITLPPEINKQILIDRIVYKDWDLMLYTTDYMLLHSQIVNFFLTKEDTYKKIVKALSETYNPLHNFDRYEVKNEKTNNAIKNKNVDNLDYSEEYTTSAYNTNTYQPKDKTTNKQTRTDTRDDTQNGTYTTDNHLYGNIGVTTSQQMLASEIELRHEYIIYDIIESDFRKEFCLCIFE